MGKGWGLKLANLLLSLYGQGLLGGLPAQERQTKQRALEQLADIQEKPTWSALTPGMQYDPAAEKLLPGQRRMDVGQQPYRVPAEKPKEELVGPTYGEAGVLSGITSKLPLGQLISAKAGPEMMRPWLGKLMGPEAAKEAVAGAMYPTTGLRNLQQFYGFMKDPEILPEQREGMEETARIALGLKEKEKAKPTGYKATGGWIWDPRKGELVREIPSDEEEFTLGPGQKRFKGKEVIAEVEALDKAKGQTNKELIMNYKRAIDQTLKKYGIDSGMSFETRPDGTMAINMGGKESIYQSLQKKAEAGHIRAAQDLEKINHWYEQIDKVIGVPEEITGRSEEERQLDALDPLRIR